jgi:hypothetical protein
VSPGTWPTRLIHCGDCGRLHLPESMVPDPDRPPLLLCPVTTRGVMRLAPWERTVSDHLLRSAFGEAA